MRSIPCGEIFGALEFKNLVGRIGEAVALEEAGEQGR
jgi:hypothetical protein